MTRYKFFIVYPVSEQNAKFFFASAKKSAGGRRVKKKMDIKRQKLRASFRAQVHEDTDRAPVERQKGKSRNRGCELNRARLDKN